MTIKGIKYINSKENEFMYGEQKVQDLEHLFGISITIHDPKGMLRHPNGQSVFTNRTSHQHPYCVLDRYEKPAFDQFCLQHCQQKIHLQALASQNPFTSLCWKGVKEVVLPIYKNEIHFFTFFAGAFKEPGKYLPHEEISITRKIKASQIELENYDEGKSEQIARSLESLGLYLLDYIEQAPSTHASTDRKQLIRNFFLYHAHENIKLEDLAKALFLSSSRASHLIKELYQKSFQEILIEERIKRAKMLLTNSRRTIRQIAENIGIKNEFYLSRLFKKKVGLSPGKFRKEMSNNKPSQQTN